MFLRDAEAVGFEVAAGSCSSGQRPSAGRAGIARITAQLREDDFDVIDDEHSTKPYFGVSVGYDFNRRFGLSLNLDRRQADFDGVDVDVDTIAVGGEFRF